MGTLPIIIIVAVIIFYVYCMWKIFEKAGQPGWGAIIPFYNYYLMTKMAEKPGWWTILMIIPYVNFIFIIWVWNRIVKRFGKSTGFTVGVILLGFIFIPILAFGDAQYKGDRGIDTSNENLLDDKVVE